MERPWLVLAILLATISGIALLVGRGGSLGDPQQTVEPTWKQQVEAVERGEADTIHLTQHAVSDDEFKDLRGLTGLRQLKLQRGHITAASLESLGNLPDLHTLWLWESPLDDRATAMVAKNRGLKRLNFPHAVFTDEGLALLVGLPELEQLRFSSPNVTAAGLGVLGKAKSMRLLHLIDVPVTAVVLEEIARLEHLESLYFDGVELDSEAMERFFVARPDIHVHIDQLHHERDPNAHPHRPAR